MKRGFLTAVVAVLSAVTFFGNVSVSAYADTAEKAQTFIDGIVDFKLSQTESGNVQEWIDGALCETAGTASEWYIFALSRYGDYDFSKYQKALSDYIKANNRRSASTELKYALVLASVGSTDSYISESVVSATGGQGIMSYVYGLHMLNNGYESENISADEVIDEILSLQKNDGGWAVMGDNAETDTTAMTIQALAPHYSKNETVKSAVDKALLLLSERQLEDGDFASYGVPNPESTAQVLTALTSLGIDPLKDERFVKNGNNLIDGIGVYRNADGSFSHEKGKEYSDSATVQALYSLISYIRFSEGRTPLYILEKEVSKSEEEAPVQEINEADKSVPESNQDNESVNENKVSEKSDYKPIVCVVIIAASVGAVIILAVLKKAKKQNVIAVLILGAAAVLFVLFTDFSSAEDYYGSKTVKENPTGTVTLSIRCDTVVEKSDKEYIPKDGIILYDTFEIEAGETVFDILTQAARQHGIQLDYSGGADSVYIAGINYLYEFDYGDLSGWLYFVNGEQPSVGCDRYILTDGDKIEWLYSCEMGKDF